MNKTLEELSVIAEQQHAAKMDNDEALNTLATLFHHGKQVKDSDGSLMMAVDIDLWDKACEAFESLFDESDEA